MLFRSAVEAVVAAVLLSGSVVARSRSRPRVATEATIIAAAAIAAYAGLVL